MIPEKHCPECAHGCLSERLVAVRSCDHCSYTSARRLEPDKNLDIVEVRVKARWTCPQCDCTTGIILVDGGTAVRCRACDFIAVGVDPGMVPGRLMPMAGRASERDQQHERGRERVMSQGERCPGCWYGRLIMRVGFQECTNVECDYTTAGQPEHDPEPSPDKYRLSTVEKWHLPVGASPDAVKYGTLMVDAGMIDASRYIADTVHIADRDEMDRARPGLKPKCSGCGVDLWQMAGGFVECPNRNCALSGEARAKEPSPEAEVTELERLRCLVKTLEAEAQTLRVMVAEWNQRLAIARGQTAEWKQRYMAERGMLRAEWQSAKLDTELYAGNLAAEKSEHLSTRLKLVTALAEFKALREKYGEPETGPQPERAESRLGKVPDFVFERGPRVTYGEEG